MKHTVGWSLLVTILTLSAAGCIEVADLVTTLIGTGDSVSGDGLDQGMTGGGQNPGRSDDATDDPTTPDDSALPDDVASDDTAGATEPEDGEGIPPLPAGGALTTNFSGLQVYDFVFGAGRRPERTDQVVVDYIGYLPDGTVFDSGETVTFPLAGVIEGFAEGIEGMNEGGRRRIVIPPALGYGPGGNASAGIGGEDTITFDVTLHSVL